MSPRRVLISGTSSGFGALIARKLASEGYVVFAGMRDITSRHAATAAALRAHASERGQRLEVVELDVTSERSVADCVAHIERSGGLDIVIHNAGVAAAGLTETFTAEDAAQIFGVNVFGVIRLQRAVLPLLRQSVDPLVVYLSSTLAREVMPFLSLYTASKHALDALAEGWRYELSQLGIRTAILQPGTFPTTGMITRLLPPSDPKRAEAYGDFATAPASLFGGIEAMVAAGAAPDPSLVVQGVLEALSPKAPTRSVIDPNGAGGAARLNALSHSTQAALLSGLGVSVP